jgi:hypothetical protein
MNQISIYTKPSYWANMIQGIMILLLLIFLWIGWRSVKSTYEKIIIILLFTLVIGVHGLLHLGLEKTYDWNPMEGKWI